MSTLLVGRKAPSFSTKAVHEGKIVDFSLDDLQGKYIVLFFYPLDFTFVCPTELHAFQEKIKAFEERGACVVACSVDSCYSHYAWLSTPRAKGGIQGVSYPIVSDLTKSISRSYHVLDEDNGISYRGLFIIDQEGIVRHQLVNDLPIGRSVEEVLRVLDAFISYKRDGQVCPANWHPGEKKMKADQEGLVNFFSE